MRAAPQKIPPISHNGIRYAVRRFEEGRFGQSGGVVQALNESTGTELWIVKVYSIIFDPDMEKDVQEIYIRSIQLSPEQDALLVIDERRRRYRITLADGTVLALD